MISNTLAFMALASSWVAAESFVDPRYFDGCHPVAGEVSCGGKVSIASDGGYGLDHFPENIVGYPEGKGDKAPQNKPNALLSLGTRGTIVLKMTESVKNLTGPDIRVFENPFYRHDLEGKPDKFNAFMDWAFVEVSQDGTNFYRFPSQVDKSQGDYRSNPYRVLNLAGVFPVYAQKENSPFALQVFESDGTRTVGEGPGGDDFDLSTIDEDLEWILYIRLIDAGEPGALSAKPTAGFDLDTVVGLH